MGKGDRPVQIHRPRQAQNNIYEHLQGHEGFKQKIAFVVLSPLNLI